MKTTTKPSTVEQRTRQLVRMGKRAASVAPLVWTWQRENKEEYPLPVETQAMYVDLIANLLHHAARVGKQNPEMVAKMATNHAVGELGVKLLAKLEEREQKEAEKQERRTRPKVAAVKSPSIKDENEEDDDTDPGDFCTACGRASLDCSKKPCEDVIRDRGETPTPCAKCGEVHSKEDSYTDKGTGTEEGKTFYYCSRYCRENH